MFIEAIHGMEKVFQTEPPEGSIILIIGGAGTLKSAFTYNLISNYLKARKDSLDQAIYVTLEETRASLLSNIKSMGIQPSERVLVSDIASFMREFEYWSENLTTEKDYVSLILEKASRPLKIYNRYDYGEVDFTIPPGKDIDKGLNEDGMPEPAMRPTIFVLDSLNALNSIVYRSIRNVRKEMNSFMFKLREKGVTSFILMEVGDPDIHRAEYFLVDGIIELGIAGTKHDRHKRFLKVHKMRSTKHSIEPFLIDVTDNGIMIVDELI
jgi:KaiC/GvpD/RAD55 family RecA-like ATPase